MSDEEEACDDEECSCGGKPPYAVAVLIQHGVLSATVYICDSIIEGREHMVMGALQIPSEECPHDVQEAVVKVIDFMNIESKKAAPSMIAEIDQRAAEYNAVFGGTTPPPAS